MDYRRLKNFFRYRDRTESAEMKPEEVIETLEDSEPVRAVLDASIGAENIRGFSIDTAEIGNFLRRAMEDMQLQYERYDGIFDTVHYIDASLDDTELNLRIYEVSQKLYAG